MYELLFCKYHFVEQVFCSSDLFDGKEYITYVEGDVAADLRIEDDVAHRSFPYAVKVESDQISVRIDDWASGVSAGGVVSRDETYRHLTRCICPSSVVLLCIDVAKALRDIVVEDIRIVLFHDSLDCRRRCVIYAVGRGVSLDMAVRHSESEVRIRIECLSSCRTVGRLRQVHLAAHIVAVCEVELAVEAGCMRLYISAVPFQELIEEHEGRVCEDLVLVFCGK